MLKIMERRYTLLAILLIGLSFILVLLPKKGTRKEADPKVLLSSIVGNSRFLSADQVTERMIGNDPTLLLIDIRPNDQFRAFSLPGAINMDPGTLLNEANFEILNQPGKDKVLLANADMMADKAWMTLTRYSVKRLYVLRGGLNEWFNTFIRIKEPAGTPSGSELDLISFRKAARQFFVGSGEQAQTAVVPVVKPKTELVRKEPKSAAGGGC